MKKIEDIERMEIDELETAATQADIPVPDGLQDRIKSAITAHQLLEDKKQSSQAKWLPYASFALAAALIAALVFIPRNTLPKDSFEDPYLAYAQVEDAFRTISDKIAIGVEMANKAADNAEKPLSVFTK